MRARSTRRSRVTVHQTVCLPKHCTTATVAPPMASAAILAATAAAAGCAGEGGAESPSGKRAVSSSYLQVPGGWWELGLG